MLSIGYLTKAQAEELGLKIQTRAVGPDSLGVEIQFWKEGKLKMFGDAKPFTWTVFQFLKRLLGTLSGDLTRNVCFLWLCSWY